MKLRIGVLWSKAIDHSTVSHTEASCLAKSEHAHEDGVLLKATAAHALPKEMSHAANAVFDSAIRSPASSSAGRAWPASVPLDIASTWYTPSEATVREFLRGADRSGLELWISRQRWVPRSDGWNVVGSLEGWLFNITAMPQAILVTAAHPSQAGSRWIVAPFTRSIEVTHRRRRY